ncbi:DMT family transporter [Paracidovorax wautersii]|uniref:Drug/metabolite transporter (DMT)-like permease n=1 Tax=Paracidovorax wautersii TaxID=1177982 RepID=A0ABU1IED7_9BURK|nr:DMT family transporter [Paracidovorax wautersii]MDR6214644.1 drug/metabolite transporter (DMT)-like permease [Paracidovorax wautersii]
MSTAAPLLFVLIWSTGFLVGRGVAAHADPFWFLAARFVCVASAFTAAALWARVAWPRGARRIGWHLLAGALMSGLYLGPSWWAMAQGLPAGIMSLIGALQPLFTALIAVAVLQKRLSGRTWAGLALGFGGVALVLLPRLQATDAGALSLPVVLVAAGSILALTVGSMVQKSPLATGDLRSASAVQNVGAVLVLAAMALVFGQPHWDNTPLLWGYLAFAVLVLSIGGATLLIWLMRHGEATRTTALLLAVPPLSALQAWLIFDETLSAVQLVGFVVAIAGVALARSR